MNIDALIENGIRLKEYTMGNHKVKCPQCQPPHKLSDNPLSVTINEEGAVWFCHHCEWTGSASSSQPIRTGNQYKKKEYKRPEAPKDPKVTNALTDFFKNRGISKELVQTMKIYQEGNWVCFPYFNENEELVNIKKRSPDKQFQQSKDAEQYLYNYKNAMSADTLVFVEGEMDVLSIAEAGYISTSLPNGAPKEPKYKKGDARFRALENCPLKAKKIILFTDMDTAGKALHKELLHRFGKDRCWWVKPPQDCKDANEVLVKHGLRILKNLIEEAKPYPVDGLYTAHDYLDEVKDLYHGNYTKPVDIGMAGLDKIYKVMKGTFHTITGIPNHGKSIFMDQVLLKLAANHDWKFAIFSPEHSTPMHIRRLVQMYKEKSFDEGFTNRMSLEELNDAVEFIHDHFYFIETKDTIPDISTILQIAQSSVYKYGINGIMIDPYNEVSAKRSGNQREDEHIRDFISLCKRFAKTYDIVCWVVAHPTKLPKSETGGYAPPTSYEISGSSHWSNQSDVIITVHRDFDENSTRIITRKIREQGLYGNIGEVKFVYDTAKRSFKPYIEEVSDNDWSSYNFVD